MRFRRPVLAATLAASFAAPRTAPLAAQRLGPPADRPALRDASDTNDAGAYYRQGLELFERDPGAAADAFYWAARINPAWGEAVYARRSALLMRDRGLMKRHFERGRNGRIPDELVRLDSLQFQALMANPFLYRRLERPMFMRYIRDEISRGSGAGIENESETRYYIEQYLNEAGPETRAWLSYADGAFGRALTLYATALDRTRDPASVHLERARIFGMQGNVDSAVVEFDQALARLRTDDQKRLVVFYDSKAQAEFSKGVLLEGAGNAAAAREAYAAALQEDLAYYPAHTRLGLLSLGAKDTTSAMSELALAAQLAATDPQVRYLDGYVLAVAGHRAEAVAEFREAVELEPYYALPYLRLGQVYEQLGKGPEALSSYQAFLARASRQDPQRAYAEQRIAEVKDILSVPAAPAP